MRSLLALLHCAVLLPVRSTFATSINWEQGIQDAQGLHPTQWMKSRTIDRERYPISTSVSSGLSTTSKSAINWEQGIQDAQGLHPTQWMKSRTIDRERYPISRSISSPPLTTSEALCFPQNESPGLGYASPFCKCPQGTSQIHLPLITPTPAPALNNPRVSCAYTSLPVSSDQNCMQTSCTDE